MITNKVNDFKIFKTPSQSRENQDVFAYLNRALFHKNQDPGIFIDIGCYDPVIWSNTFSLEWNGWSGFLIDNVEKHIKRCKEIRKNSVSEVVDVTADDFEKFLKNNNLNGKTVDYISLDADRASVPALKCLLNNNVSFDCMTFEHDSEIEKDVYARDESRLLLTKAGYICVFQDVLLEHKGYEGLSCEDWWVSNRIYDNVYSGNSFSRLSNSQCIGKLIDILKEG